MEVESGWLGGGDNSMPVNERHGLLISSAKEMSNHCECF